MGPRARRDSHKRNTGGVRLDVRKKEWRDEGQLEGVQGREVEAQKGEEVDKGHAGDKREEGEEPKVWQALGHWAAPDFGQGWPARASPHRATGQCQGGSFRG